MSDNLTPMEDSSMLTPEGEQTASSIKGINDLPVEIISYIMEFLPYTYLLDARLVCQHWYTASLAPSLLNREKVVFLQSRSGLPTDTLLKSRRTFWNFCFKGDFVSPHPYEENFWSDWVHLYDEKFWTHCGPQLRSLSFHKCEIKKDKFLKTLSHSPQLRSIEVSGCKLQSSSKEKTTIDDQYKPKLLHLESLTIDSGQYTDDHGDLFDSLVGNATALKSLILVNCMIDKGIFGTTYLTPEHVLRYIRKNTDSIVNVSFIPRPPNNGDAIVELLEIPNLKLRSLETNYLIPVKLASHLKSLRVFKLRSFILVVPRLELYFNELQNLKCLEIDDCDSSAISNLHLLRNLTSLELGISLLSEKDPNLTIVRCLCSEENRILKKMSLRGHGSLRPQTVVAVAKSYPALELFKLDWHHVESWDFAIQGIFKYQVSLQSLQLTFLDSLTDDGLQGKRLQNLPDLDNNVTGYSFARLKNLWKLSLDGFRMAGTSFKYLVLPELREVSLIGVSQVPEALETFLKNHPKIEWLLLRMPVRCRPETFDVIASSLPRLKYVHLEFCYGTGITEEAITKLKKRCKSVILRGFV